MAQASNGSPLRQAIAVSIRIIDPHRTWADRELRLVIECAGGERQLERLAAVGAYADERVQTRIAEVNHEQVAEGVPPILHVAAVRAIPDRGVVGIIPGCATVSAIPHGTAVSRAGKQVFRVGWVHDDVGFGIADR